MLEEQHFSFGQLICFKNMLFLPPTVFTVMPLKGVLGTN